MSFFTFLATVFDLRYHPDVVVLVDSFHNASDNYTVVNGTLTPPEPYEVHSVHLQLPAMEEMTFGGNYSEMVYFAVKTLDEEQNMGHISNVVFVRFTLEVDKYEPERFFNKYVVIGIVIGAAVCLILIISMVSCLVMQGRKKQSKLIDDSKSVSYTGEHK